MHGDIKPENIILTKRGGKTVFKLVDFGSIVEMFSIASRAGTPSYLSPERFDGGAISERSEIFAIGVTLYEALTGHFPYGEIEPFQTPHFKVPARPTGHNKKIPGWLEHIILHAIERDPERRYRNYSEMAFELSQPAKVKPHFEKHVSLLERNPAETYKWLFFIMLLANILLWAYCNR